MRRAEIQLLISPQFRSTSGCRLCPSDVNELVERDVDAVGQIAADVRLHQ
jgi:hypothetical protein